MKNRPKNNNRPNMKPSYKPSKTNKVTPVIDRVFVDEMKIHEENEAKLYPSYLAWKKNFDRKAKRGVLDKEKAIYGLEKYYVPKVIKSYDKVYGGSGYNKNMKAEKRRIAEEVYNDYLNGRE